MKNSSEKLFEYLYPEEVNKILNGWKDLIKEYERQYSKGTLTQKQFQHYKEICNKQLIETQKLITRFSLYVKKV